MYDLRLIKDNRAAQLGKRLGGGGKSRGPLPLPFKDLLGLRQDLNMSEDDLSDKVVAQLKNGPATLTALATTLDRPVASLLVVLKELQRGGFAQIRDSKWSLTEEYKRLIDRATRCEQHR